jgi:hypothetical protein
MVERKIICFLVVTLVLFGCNRHWRSVNMARKSIYDFIEPKIEECKPILKLHNRIYNEILKNSGVKDITLEQNCSQNISAVQNVLLSCPRILSEHDECCLLNVEGLPINSVYYNALPVFLVDNKNVKKVKKILNTNRISYREIFLDVKKNAHVAKSCGCENATYLAYLKIYHRTFTEKTKLKCWSERKYTCYLDSAGAIVKYKLRSLKIEKYSI